MQMDGRSGGVGIGGNSNPSSLHSKHLFHVSNSNPSLIQ